MHTFIDDVRASMATIREVRWLLPAALAVALVGPALSWLGDTPLAPALLLAPVWWLIWLGWWGTERVVMARHTRGEELGRRNVWASIQILGPRYVRLALLLVPAVVPSVIAAMAWGAGAGATRGVTAAVIGVVAATMAFVTPALALSTSRVRSALVIGWRVLRSSWSEVRGHVLVPAVTLAGLALLPVSLGGIVTAVAAGIVGLVFRGATTWRYVELVDVFWDDVPGGVWRRRVAIA